MASGGDSKEEWIRRCDERFRDSTAELPTDFCQSLQAAADLSRAFHQVLAEVLQPRLNAYVKTLPQETLADKRSIATWVNAELRKLGLTIRCPKTGNPAILVADTQDRVHGHITRFRLEARDDRGRNVRSCTSPTVPELELMKDPPRRESLSRKSDVGGGGLAGP